MSPHPKWIINLLGHISLIIPKLPWVLCLLMCFVVAAPCVIPCAIFFCLIIFLDDPELWLPPQFPHYSAFVIFLILPM